MRNLIKNFQNFSHEQELWKKGDKIVLGISGGPDSVCLFDIFLKLKQKALETGFISEEEGSQIFKSIKSLSKTEKESSYNRMLGKKFLWDNYNPTKARNYILKSIKLKPFILKSYFLLFLSFFPNSLIKSIYQIKKR